MVLIEIDVFMLGIFKDSEIVAIYSVAKNITSKLTQINLALSTGTMNYFSVITTENYYSKYKSFRKVIGLNIILTFSIFIF